MRFYKYLEEKYTPEKEFSYPEQTVRNIEIELTDEPGVDIEFNWKHKKFLKNFTGKLKELAVHVANEIIKSKEWAHFYKRKVGISGGVLPKFKSSDFDGSFTNIGGTIKATA